MTPSRVFAVAAAVLLSGSLLLSLALPPTFLDRTPLVSIAVSSVAAVAGSVDRLGELSMFPDRTRTVLAAVWITSAVFTLLGYRALAANPILALDHYRSVRGKLLIALPAAAYCLVVFPLSLHLLDPSHAMGSRSSGMSILLSAGQHPLILGCVAGVMGLLVTVSAAHILFCLRYAVGIFGARGDASTKSQ